MDSIWARIAHNPDSRVIGPMKFRLVLKPVTAATFAVRPGLADASAGKPPYFCVLVSDPAQRADMVTHGWKSVGEVFILALVLDVVYQIIALHFLYAGEAIVAFILAIVPYLILRGLVTRLARTAELLHKHHGPTPFGRHQ